MAFDSPPAYMDGTTLDAEVFRRAMRSLIVSGGIVTPGDLTVSQQTSPNMSVQIGIGEIWVAGTTTSSQGPYYSRNGAATTVAISASNPSNPRIDTIIAQVQDAAYAGAAKQIAPTVIVGTPTSGATLSNLNGHGTVPASSAVLAYVLVPASATSIVTADILNVTAPLVVGAGIARGKAVATINMSAPYETLLEVAPGLSIFLPYVGFIGATVGIVAGTGVTGASPVQIVAGGTAGSVFGVGLPFVSSFLLGTQGAMVWLQSDGTNWIMLPGSVQDTGWTSPTLVAATATGGSLYAPQARLKGSTVRIRGSLSASGGIFAGSTWATLPFTPTETIPLVGVFNGSPAAVTVDTSGHVSLPGLSATTGQVLSLDGCAPFDLS